MASQRPRPPRDLFITLLGCLAWGLSLAAPLARANLPFADAFEATAGPTATELYPRIEFLSDQMLLFDASGQSAELRVRVFDADGRDIPDAQVGWSSPVPGTVAVTPTGALSARVDAVASWSGPIAVTVTHAPLDLSARAQAVMAAPAPATVLIGSDRVLDIQGDRVGVHQVILARAADTAALVAGEILVTGDHAGVLARIRAVTLEADRVILDVEPALITEAFRDLDLMIEGEPLEIRMRAAAAETTVTVRSLRDGRLLRHQALPRVNLIDRLQCEGDLTLGGNLQITTLELTRELIPRVGLRIQDFTVVDFLLGIEGAVGIAAGFGVTLDGGATLAGQCAIELPSIRLPALPLGPFGLQPRLSSKAGLELTAEAQGGIRVNPPTLDRRWSFAATVRYTPAQGWQTSGASDSQDPAGGEVAGEIGGGLQLKAQAFVELGKGLEFKLGRDRFNWELVSAEFFQLAGGPYWQFGIALPIDPAQPDYTGPTVEVGVEAEAGATLKATFFEGTLARYLPLTLAADLNWTLFSLPVVLYRTAKPTGGPDCEPDCARVPTDGGGSVTFSAQAATTATGMVEFWTGRHGDGALTRLTTLPFVGGQARGTFAFNEQTEDGIYTVYPRLRLDGPGFAYTRLWPLAAERAIGEFTIGGCEDEPALIGSRYRIFGRDCDVIVDTVTGLEWRRCAVGQIWKVAQRTCDGAPSTFTWHEARELTAPGGWRAPVIAELSTLRYCSSGQPFHYPPDLPPYRSGCQGNHASPVVHPQAFPGASSLIAWSSSPHASLATIAWGVNFYNGVVAAYSKEYPGQVRLVRGGP